MMFMVLWMNWNYSHRLLKGLYRQYNKSTIINCFYFFLIPKDIVEKSQLFFVRWDVSAVRNLPDYMKLCFLALFNTVNEMAYDHLKEQGEDAIPCLTKAVCSSNLMASVLTVITYIYFIHRSYNYTSSITVGGFMQSILARSKMELQQYHTIIWGISWKCMAIGIRNCHPHPCLFSYGRKHLQASSWLPSKLRWITQMAIHYFSTL